MCSSRRRGLGCRGTGTIEFSLVVPILISAFVAVVEMARYQSAVGALRAVTAEAARVALIDPALDACVAPEARVAARAPGLSSEQLQICVTRSTQGGMAQVRVDADYEFTFAFPIFGSLTKRLTDSSVVRF